MSDYSSLKATINANVKANNNHEITGSIMNSVLNAMVDSLGANYQYKGVAFPKTNPGSPDQNVFYIAGTPGTYENFGGIILYNGEVAVLKWNGSWSKDVSQIAPKSDRDIALTWNPNQYLNKNDGSIGTDETAWSVTNPVSVPKGTKLVLTGECAGNICAICCFYDGNGDFLSYLGIGAYANYTINVPENASIVRFCTHKTETFHVQVLPSLILSLLNELNGIKEVVGNVTKLSGTTIVDNLVLSAIEWIAEMYIDKTTGGLNDDETSWSTTEPILVTPGQSIVVSGKTTGNATCFGMFYRSDNTALQEIPIGEYNDYEIVVPAGANNVRFCTNFLSLFSCSINKVYLKDIVLDNKQRIDQIIGQGVITNLQDYITNNRNVELGEGTYLLDSPLSIPSNTKIKGIRGLSIIQLNDANLIADLTGKENISFENVTFIGKTPHTSHTSLGSTLADQINAIINHTGQGADKGIYLSGSNTLSITFTNCVFRNFGFSGLHIKNTNPFYNKFKVTDCEFRDSWYGIMVDQRAEFNTFVGCTFAHNEYGAYIDGGNNYWGVCHFDMNYINVCLSGISNNNDSHGSMVGCSFNHSTLFGIAGVNVHYGYLMNGCMLYEKGIMLHNCKNIMFNNGWLSGKVIIDSEPQDQISMIHSTFFGLDYETGIEGDPQHLSLTNNKYQDGRDASAINNNI